MKSNKIFNKFLVAGALLLGTGLSSCEDYLTVLPTDKITEDDFWKTKADLDNVRASAYRQMTTPDITSRILYWGELRSDNVAQNEMTNTNIELLRKAVLHPTDGMFSWSAFYTGINYCNKVLEKGDEMTIPGSEVDPSFRRGDWLPIKAEMLSMRALYYFYLVRAYRDVPLVLHSISTDAEAFNSKIKATPGVDILGIMLEQLEEAKTYAAQDYSNAKDRKGRFTKRAISALLADMYLWRACMLSKSSEKGDVILQYNEETQQQDTLSEGKVKALSKDHLNKVIENCDFVLADIKAKYDKDVLENPSLEDDEDRNKDYPYLLFVHTFSQKFVVDNVYNEVFGSKNSDYEGVFELQYDGNISQNSTITNYFGKFEGSFKPSAMVGAAEMTSSAESTYDPEIGFGKSDFRLCETFMYTSKLSQRAPIHKNVVKTVVIPDIKNVSTDNDGASGNYRTPSAQDANWPVYRLSDVMLLKAEAIARLLPPDVKGSTEGASGELLVEGFNLVNSLFARYNPGLSPKTALSGITKEDRKRMQPASEYAKDRNSGALLSLVYRERQREFLGEGKRWFDIVRQVEASNDVENTLNTFVTLTKEVRSRLRLLPAMYLPIYSEELKVNGVEYGGGLVQNPVWDRYTVK